MDYEKIKTDKIQEANDLYKKIGIDVSYEEYIDPNYYQRIPDIHESSDKKDNDVFHWTRLSNTSNIGYTVE